MVIVLFEIAITNSGLRFRIGPLRIGLRPPSYWRHRLGVWYCKHMGFGTPFIYAYWKE